jgi:hypothetical protein
MCVKMSGREGGRKIERGRVKREKDFSDREE